jgi:hypothetical protein
MSCGRGCYLRVRAQPRSDAPIVLEAYTRINQRCAVPDKFFDNNLKGLRTSRMAPSLLKGRPEMFACFAIGRSGNIERCIDELSRTQSTFATTVKVHSIKFSRCHTAAKNRKDLRES